MVKRLINTPDGGSLLEIETGRHRRHQYFLPSSMSPAARVAFLASPRLGPVLARLEEDSDEDAEGCVTFALHKLALDLMARYPVAEPVEPTAPAAAQPPSPPVARIVIRQCSPSVFVLCTSYLDESVCREEHLDTLQDALAAAILALPPQAMAVEVTYEGVVAGTYPLPVLERNPELVARNALDTKEAIDDACRRSGRSGGLPPADGSLR